MVVIERKIVRIDEDKCDGCGLCVPSCAEGAIRVIDGKARLISENLCDGLGDCLAPCPRGAITIELRKAEAFDESAVRLSRPAGGCESPSRTGGCPGTMLRRLRSLEEDAAAPQRSAAPADKHGPLGVSRLGQWPVQLALLPGKGDIWSDADMLIAADCAPCAMGEFHERFLAGKTLAIACPKLDDINPYVEKLTGIFANNDIRSITVVHMEVPCCAGLVRMVETALARSEKDSLPVRDVTVGVDGKIRDDSKLL